MRLLLITTLYPNRFQPTRATYNRSLVRALAGLGHDVRVIAPVPWCPIIDPVVRHRRLPPLDEEIDGTRVLHPRFFYTPGVLVHWHYRFYRRSIAPVLERMYHDWRPNHVILGFVYPDAAAMASVCRELGLSYSVRVNGSDFRIRSKQRKFRSIVIQTLHDAPLIFCPGQALRRDMTAAGIDGGKIIAFNNGVDRKIFHPGQDGRCKAYGVRRKEEGQRVAFSDETISKTVLFVGNLVHVKGVDRLLRAMVHVPDAGLVIIGDGNQRKPLQRLAETLGVADRVEFLGRLSQEEVADWMRKADCLCLPSRSEGMPNVVLEALACGTPVVATAVGEVPHLLRNEENGMLVSGESEDAVVRGLASALDAALNREWDVFRVAGSVGAFSWENAAQTLIEAISECSDPSPQQKPDHR